MDALISRMQSAATSRRLSYHSFLSELVLAAEIISERRPNSLLSPDWLQVHEILEAGRALLPVIRDEPLSPTELLQYWHLGIYPIQLVSRPTRGDGVIFSPSEFLWHDILHARLDINHIYRLVFAPHYVYFREIEGRLRNS